MSSIEVSSLIPPDVAPAPELRRRQLLVASALAAGACAVFILSLLGMYLNARHQAGDAWLANNGIPLTQPTMQLFTLLMSAFTMQWAVYAISRNARSHAYMALGITLLLGVAVINQTWFLYTRVGMPIRQLEGPLFYAITGGHLAMLGAALIMVALAALRAFGGTMGSRRPDGVSSAAVFWHVQVALYCVIWLAVYVMK